MKTVRIVVVGCGTWVPRMPARTPTWKALNWSDLWIARRTRGRALSVELGGVPLYESLDEARTAVQPDAVAVCTYPESHHELTMQALRSGMHVFVEKPLAMTVAEAEEIVHAGGTEQEESRRRVHSSSSSGMATIH